MPLIVNLNQNLNERGIVFSLSQVLMILMSILIIFVFTIIDISYMIMITLYQKKNQKLSKRLSKASKRSVTGMNLKKK